MNPPTLALLVALAACAPLGCTHIHVPGPATARVEPGPPPHAPAHGADVFDKDNDKDNRKGPHPASPRRR